MTADVDVPVVGSVDKKWVYVGGAGLAGILGYAYWRSRGAAAAAPAEFGPPLPDPGATDYVNPEGYGNSSQGVVGAADPAAIDTNAKWSQKALDVLVGSAGFDAMLVTTALGKYLNRQSLTAGEKAVVISARALVGDPPVGGPYPITDALPTPTPTPTPTPAAWKGPLRRKAVGPTVMAIRVLPGGNRTWAQLLPMFYSNTPPAGSQQAHNAGEQLRHANDWRNKVKPGQKIPTGAGKWETVGGLATISVPATLNG